VFADRVKLEALFLHVTEVYIAVIEPNATTEVKATYTGATLLISY
jgi:hypothetical protein